MGEECGHDWVDGREVPQLILEEDYVLTGFHQGTVRVRSGHFVLQGVLQGTLDIQSGVDASIRGAQQGTVSIAGGARVDVTGAIEGTTSVDEGAVLEIEAGARLAGALTNHGLVILRGTFGGPESGTGELRIEETGRIKQPVVRNGVSYYEW
jgi:hypothetical protein